MPTYEHITIHPDPLDNWPEGYYEFILDKREHATIEWLNDHGYDASLWDRCSIDTSTADGTELDHDIDDAEYFRYRLPRELARAWLEEIEEDRCAYLSCNGSHSLAEKLTELESCCQEHNP